MLPVFAGSLQANSTAPTPVHVLYGCPGLSGDAGGGRSRVRTCVINITPIDCNNRYVQLQGVL